MRFWLNLLFLILISQQGYAKPQRVISLAPHLTELVYALDAQESLIAVIGHSDYPLEAKQLPIVGNYENINIEQILSLKPDLILAWTEGNPSRQLEQLSSLGLPVLYTQTGRLSEIPSLVMTLAEALEVRDAGQALSEKLTHHYHRLQAYRSKRSLRIFYQIWHQPLMTISDNNWVNDALEICGGTNIFAGSSIPYPQVNLEQVIARNPEVILIADHQNAEAPRQLWLDLQLLPEKQLLSLNPDRMNRYTPRLLDGTEELCQNLDKLRGE